MKTYGQGPKLVLVHGGPALNNYMGSLGEVLSHQFTIVEYQQEAFGIKQLIDELRLVIGNDRPMVLGHSWGAIIAGLLASRFPGLVEKLILCDCGNISNQLAEQFGKNLRSKLSKQSLNELSQLDKLEASNEVMKERLRIVGPAYHFNPNTEKKFGPFSLDYEKFKISVNDLWNLIDEDKLKPELARVKCPTLIIHGEADPIPVAITEELLELLPQAQVKVIKDAGHFPWLENPACVEEIIQFRK
jgi:proline iminopeptidase